MQYYYFYCFIVDFIDFKFKLKELRLKVNTLLLLLKEMGFKNSILKKVLNQDAKIQITNEFFKIFFLLKEKQIKRYILNKILDIIQEFF